MVFYMIVALLTNSRPAFIYLRNKKDFGDEPDFNFVVWV